MRGLEILERSLAHAAIVDKHGNEWQYHSRSDRHSKIACWGILFDLLISTPLLRRHIAGGVIGFGINHEMRDFVHDRKKDLDLVLSTPNGEFQRESFQGLADRYSIDLDAKDRTALDALPLLRRAPVGSVVMALEAKACMTAHQRALPRLYDELNSSHQTVHGASEQAIAVGFAMVNSADHYLSPDLNKKHRATDPEWSSHNQPRDAQLAIDKVRQLPRRAKVVEQGYDALAISVMDMSNDGTPPRLVRGPPAPQPGDIYHYDTMISRLSGIYATRFKDLA
ncbi:MAG: hypothetical protein H7X93_00245 [Sphingomonadaceae bacterium]|nr:hypothetical protein [Sphingomonadaceae bacterium]